MGLVIEQLGPKTFIATSAIEFSMRHIIPCVSRHLSLWKLENFLFLVNWKTRVDSVPHFNHIKSLDDRQLK